MSVEQRGVLVDGGEGACERLRGELPRAIDALPEPDGPHFAHDVMQRALLGNLGDEQADGVRTAVDGPDDHGRSSSFDEALQGLAAHH